MGAVFACGGLSVMMPAFRLSAGVCFSSVGQGSAKAGSHFCNLFVQVGLHMTHSILSNNVVRQLHICKQGLLQTEPDWMPLLVLYQQ